MTTTLLWFRRDLRLADNPALIDALNHGRVVPVFIHAPAEEGEWPPGAASRWWLHHSLASLSTSLRQHRSRLVIRAGSSLEHLVGLARETGATRVVWNRRYEPAVTARDAGLERALREAGLEVGSFNAALLREPWEVANRSGAPFQVFTAFWRRCLADPDPAPPAPPPDRLTGPGAWPGSLDLETLSLLPSPDWAGGLRATWQPGEAGARAALDHFLTHAFPDYADDRNRPDRTGTSRLSPHLHFGEIGPRQVWHALREHASRQGWSEERWRRSQFLAELGWREFAHHLLFHFPHTPTRPLRAEFDRFPWRDDPGKRQAWEQGQTGFPLVDAGLRELWSTGWMHNRVRMVTASFLVKNLLIPWAAGARWFWDTLVDADLANNTLGWQWTAGCGADAAPYFRIFNPTAQGEKFDPAGDYVRHWVPELARLSARWIQRPAEAPPAVLHQAGVTLGRTYPAPLVPHSIAREVALEAHQRMKRNVPPTGR